MRYTFKFLIIARKTFYELRELFVNGSKVLASYYTMRLGVCQKDKSIEYFEKS